MTDQNESIILTATYEINPYGECLNCKCLIPLSYCKAFGEQFSVVRKIKGKYTPDQLLRCKQYLQMVKPGDF